MRDLKVYRSCEMRQGLTDQKRISCVIFDQKHLHGFHLPWLDCDAQRNVSLKYTHHLSGEIDVSTTASDVPRQPLAHLCDREVNSPPVGVRAGPPARWRSQPVHPWITNRGAGWRVRSGNGLRRIGGTFQKALDISGEQGV